MKKDLIISFLSQKGGVGKSTLACLLATELIKEGLDCVLIDLDVAQTTSVEWATMRAKYERKPDVTVIRKSTLAGAKRVFQNDMDGRIFVVDTPGKASKQTLEIAKQSDVIILPASVSLSTLRPQLVLAIELVKKGIPEDKIAFVLNFSKSEHAEEATWELIQDTGAFHMLKPAIPHQVAFTHGINRGQTLAEVQHGSLRKITKPLVKALVAFIESQLETNESHGRKAERKPIK